MINKQALAALLTSRKAPIWQGTTVGDLVEYAQDLELAHALSEADKAAAKKYIKE